MRGVYVKEKLNFQSTGSGIVVIGDRVWINGKELPKAPGNGNSNISVVINNKAYINGYEFVDGEWKRTLKSIWVCYKPW